MLSSLDPACSPCSIGPARKTIGNATSICLRVTIEQCVSTHCDQHQGALGLCVSPSVLPYFSQSWQRPTPVQQKSSHSQHENDEDYPPPGETPWTCKTMTPVRSGTPGVAPKLQLLPQRSLQLPQGGANPTPLLNLVLGGEAGGRSRSMHG